MMESLVKRRTKYIDDAIKYKLDCNDETIRRQKMNKINKNEKYVRCVLIRMVSGFSFILLLNPARTDLIVTLSTWHQMAHVSNTSAKFLQIKNKNFTTSTFLFSFLSFKHFPLLVVWIEIESSAENKSFTNSRHSRDTRRELCGIWREKWERYYNQTFVCFEFISSSLSMAKKSFSRKGFWLDVCLQLCFPIQRLQTQFRTF